MGLIIFGINDIADRESDAINPRKGGIDGAVISTKEVRTVRNVVYISAVLFLLLFIVGRRYLSALGLLGIVVFAYAYSVEPIRLKTRPAIDAVSNGFWLVLIFLIGLFISNIHISASHELWARLSVTFLAGFAFHTLGTVLDYDSDKVVGEKTIGLLLGRRKALALSLILLLYSSLVSSNLTLHIFFGTCTFLNLILFINPDPKLIAQFKKVFFYMLAVLLPVVYSISYFIGGQHK